MFKCIYILLCFSAFLLSCNEEDEFENFELEKVKEFVSNYNKLYESNEQELLKQYIDSLLNSDRVNTSAIQKIIFVKDIVNDTTLSINEKIEKLSLGSILLNHNYFKHILNINLANLYVKQGYYSEAIKLLDSNIKSLSENESDYYNELAISYSKIGIIAQSHTKEIELCIKSYEAAAEYYSKTNEIQKAASSLYNAGLANSDLLGKPLSNPYCYDVISLLEQVNDYNNLVKNGFICVIYSTENEDSILKYSKIVDNFYLAKRLSDKEYYNYLLHEFNLSVNVLDYYDLFEAKSKMYEKYISKNINEDLSYGMTVYFWTAYQYAKKKKKSLSKRKQYLQKSLNACNKLEDGFFKYEHSILLYENLIPIGLQLGNKGEVISWYKEKNLAEKKLDELKEKGKATYKTQLNMWHNKEIDLLKKININEKKLAIEELF